MGTLEHALDAYFQPELMEGDNAYLCEAVDKKVPAIKRTLIEKLPHTLVVHLKRFEFNYVHMTRFKISERFEFPAELDLRRYTPEGAAATCGTTAGGDGSADGAAAPTAGAPAATEQLPANHYFYDLKGVVVHTGNAFAGHYYSFAKERGPSGGGWQCFDDTTVTPWDPSNMDECCFGGPTGPNGHLRPNQAYMLVYERKDEFEPIHVCPHLQPNAAPDATAAASAAPAAQAHPPSAEAAAPVEANGVRETASHPIADAQASSPSGEGSASGSPMSQAGPPCAVPYGMPKSLFARIMQENLWLAQAWHLTAPYHTSFLKDLLIECLNLKGNSDCHDVRHSMANAGSAMSGKTLACDARAASQLKRLAVISEGMPTPAAILPDDGADAPPSREALAALLALQHTLATLVFVNTEASTLKFFLESIESGLERQLAVEASLATMLRSLRWQLPADVPTSNQNALISSNTFVRTDMCKVISCVVGKVFGEMTPDAVLKGMQEASAVHQLVRTRACCGWSCLELSLPPDHGPAM